jgi:hypothetical protein
MTILFHIIQVIQKYDDKLQDPTSGGGGSVPSTLHVSTSAILVLIMLVQRWGSLH